jgi:hypothetical protein
LAPSILVLGAICRNIIYYSGSYDVQINDITFAAYISTIFVDILLLCTERRSEADCILRQRAALGVLFYIKRRYVPGVSDIVLFCYTIGGYYFGEVGGTTPTDHKMRNSP